MKTLSFSNISIKASSNSVKYHEYLLNKNTFALYPQGPKVSQQILSEHLVYAIRYLSSRLESQYGVKLAKERMRCQYKCKLPPHPGWQLNCTWTWATPGTQGKAGQNTGRSYPDGQDITKGDFASFWMRSLARMQLGLQHVKEFQPAVSASRMDIHWENSEGWELHTGCLHNSKNKQTYLSTLNCTDAWRPPGATNRGAAISFKAEQRATVGNARETVCSWSQPRPSLARTKTSTHYLVLKGVMAWFMYGRMWERRYESFTETWV